MLEKDIPRLPEFEQKTHRCQQILMTTRSFTARGVQLQMGETTTYRHAGYRTVVTPVLLASPLKQHPVGTVIGRVQRREYSGTRRRIDNATFTDRCAVIGYDYDWLVREFMENQGGERQARLDRIQTGRLYMVMRMFGYLAHDPCIYEKGTAIEIKEVSGATITTRIHREKKRPISTCWKRESFEALASTFAIAEEG
jgi:hypothetical protein